MISSWECSQVKILNSKLSATKTLSPSSGNVEELSSSLAHSILGSRSKEGNRRRSLKCEARVMTSSMLFPFLRTRRIAGKKSTAVCQVVACAPVTQRARVRSPVGTSFLGGVFRSFSSPVRQMSGSFRPQGPRISFGHHYHHQSSFITDANNLRC